MPLLLLFAFIVVPLLELWVIGQVADAITLGPTLVLLLVDSVLGAWLVRREGSRTWQAFREALEAGRIPGAELTEGALLLFGGALLLTPGFLTDLVGLALVVPVTRRPIAGQLRRRASPQFLRVGVGAWQTRGDGDAGGARDRGRGGATGAGEGVEVVSIERDDPPAVGDGGGDRA